MRLGAGLALISTYKLAVCVLIAVCVWKNAQPRPCRATFERVRVGMAREEVEATVGAPPGDYTPPAVDVLRGPEHTIGVVGTEIWLTDQADLWVLFDEAGRAQSVKVRDVLMLGRAPTRWDRLWAWVTTGQDDMQCWPRYSFPSGLFDLSILRRIIQP